MHIFEWLNLIQKIFISTSENLKLTIFTTCLYYISKIWKEDNGMVRLM